MDRWEQDFDFYMARIEGQPASFVIDLAAAVHAPVASHPIQLSIRVPMLSPRPDGLRDGGELDALGALEDQFVAALEAKVDAIYVGRVVHAGDTTLYLYVPEAHRDALESLPELTGAPPEGYDPSWGVGDDPDWDQYRGFLAPDEYAHQSIWNRRLVKIFVDGGDQLEVVREVDHLATFASREAAEQAASALTAAGYRCDPVALREPDDDDDEGDEGEDDGEGEDDAEAGEDDAEAGEVSAASAEVDDDADEEPDGDADEASDGEADAEDRWALSFHRDDALADDRPDTFVVEILDVILPLGGSYDGWGASHHPG